MGGQIGDTGVIETDSAFFKVEDTVSLGGGRLLILVICKVVLLSLVIS